MKTIRAADLPFVPASHEDPRWPGAWKRVLCRKDDLQPGAVQMINWSKLPVGKSFAPHYHEDMQEVFVLMAGQAKITVGPETVTLGPGDAILIDAREVHQMWNVGGEDVEYIALGIAGGVGGRTVVVP